MLVFRIEDSQNLLECIKTCDQEIGNYHFLYWKE